MEWLSDNVQLYYRVSHWKLDVVRSTHLLFQWVFGFLPIEYFSVSPLSVGALQTRTTFWWTFLMNSCWIFLVNFLVDFFDELFRWTFLVNFLVNFFDELFGELFRWTFLVNLYGEFNWWTFWVNFLVNFFDELFGELFSPYRVLFCFPPCLSGHFKQEQLRETYVG